MTTAYALRAYRQVEGQGVPGEKLFMLGLDGVLEYLRRAEAALQQGDLAAKGAALGRAYQLVEHLLAALPEPAAEQQQLGQRLERIYRHLLDRLAHANIFDDPQAMAECREVVQALRESWVRSLEQAAG